MFTIVIASYNQQGFLPDAIESALGQSLPCDIVVVNDGSTDSSLEITKGYPVRVIDQVNKGLASARNTGIMNAAGDYIIFLDADDILFPDYAEKCVEYFARGFDVVSPSFRAFGTSGQEVILMPEPKLEDFKDGNRIGYCSAIKKSALQEVGGYNPRMQEGYEDLALTINLLTRGKKIATIPEVLWLYRTKEESMFTKITPEIHKKLLAQINADFKTELNF